jgi:predicted ATP-grasp superfamily ATP-dependent carboligase
MPVIAVVMNMYYTGLGIARSLGERGVPVIGLTAKRGVFGNFTRYAKTKLSPDSQRQPEELLAFLVALGRKLGPGNVIFPTRDDDVVFLDRYRRELQEYFSLVIPDPAVVAACLNKWETFCLAGKAGVPAPKCWMITGSTDLQQIAGQVNYPCVLKPVSAHHWRSADNWQLVAGRKAVLITSFEELKTEYALVSRADRRALLQEWVPGGDDSLMVAACYMNRQGRFVAGFNTQKLLQSPPGFGTGCIVQSVNRPELFAPTIRLLETMRYTGIAEVEYKWNAAAETYELIEINPRPWDQHRLGDTCGTDLILQAYCDHAGLQPPAVPSPASLASVPAYKWIAEDTVLYDLLRMAWARDRTLRSVIHLLRGKRIYAIWCRKDPVPFLAYLVTRAIPGVVAWGARRLWSAVRALVPRQAEPVKQRPAI